MLLTCQEFLRADPVSNRYHSTEPIDLNMRRRSGQSMWCISLLCRCSQPAVIRSVLCSHCVVRTSSTWLLPTSLLAGVVSHITAHDCPAVAKFTPAPSLISRSCEVNGCRHDMRSTSLFCSSRAVTLLFFDFNPLCEANKSKHETPLSHSQLPETVAMLALVLVSFTLPRQRMQNWYRRNPSLLAEGITPNSALR